MLQLVEIKETNIDEVLNQIFILTFKDENLPEEVWSLLKKDLMDNKYQINRLGINAEAIVQLK